MTVLEEWRRNPGSQDIARTELTVLLPCLLCVGSISLQYRLIGILEAQVGSRRRTAATTGPRAMREHLVMSSIGSRDVAGAEGSNIRRVEHFL
jgi:hypothetical protein